MSMKKELGLLFVLATGTLAGCAGREVIPAEQEPGPTATRSVKEAPNYPITEATPPPSPETA